MTLTAAFQVIFTFFIRAKWLLQISFLMHIFQLFLLVFAALSKFIEEIFVVLATRFMADI